MFKIASLTKIFNKVETIVTDCNYYSQDQVTNYSHAGLTDEKTYRNTYDYAGRLQKVEYYTGPPDAPNPDYLNLTEYEYNPNSQISTQKFNDEFMQIDYSYNDRSWITAVDNSSKLFEYSNEYFKNGNVKSMELSGEYSLNFASASDLAFEYEYDRSNRLKEAKTSEKNFDVENTYDKDGNILTLDRNGSSGNQIDDFNYIYFSGTNKLQRVTGSGTQYTYDANGNMTSDGLNKNSIIKYDHRNLITELQHLKYILNDSITYYTYYSYDEAGNRFAKTVYKYTGEGMPSDTPHEESEGFYWVLDNAEIYSRDVSGREMAIYKNDTLLEYPVYGLDMIGKIKDDEAYFYYKDHLGSVRAVVNANNELLSAQDYDQWGYLLQERTYESDSSKFKFTSKERDEESEYDYFGARYYDSRIGRWGQVDPLLDKYPSMTPYNYSVDNPLRVIDPNGLDPFEIIVRTYIPFDIVFPGFKGDSRGADPNAGSFRTEQRVTVETDRSKSPTIIQNENAILSPSLSINPMGMPPFLSGIGEGSFSTVASYSSDVNEGNNASVELTGEAHVGVIPTALSPAIDYSFGITILPRKDGTVQVLLSGSHDKFPAYEIYVKDKLGNVTPIYNQSPVDPVRGPIDLFPFPIGDSKTKVNSNQLLP